MELSCNQGGQNCPRNAKCQMQNDRIIAKHAEPANRSPLVNAAPQTHFAQTKDLHNHRASLGSSCLISRLFRHRRKSVCRHDPAWFVICAISIIFCRPCNPMILSRRCPGSAAASDASTTSNLESLPRPRLPVTTLALLRWTRSRPHQHGQ